MLGACWAYRLGAYILGAYRLTPTNLGSRRSLTELGSTHWSLHAGGQQAWAINLGSRRPLIELGAYRLRAYMLGAYRLGPPILDLGVHSLNWGLESGADRLGA